jgi:hypothetical protein
MFSRRHQDKSSYGWKGIGIQWEGITNGTRATGLGRRTQEPIGYRHITIESSTLWVIGAETAVELNMIIIGTTDETGTETTNTIESAITIESTITTMIRALVKA